MNVKTLKLEGRKAFSLLTGINREIMPKQVTKLAESIDKMGIIRPVVVCTIAFITGKLTTYILDGQHLYLACIRNKMDIPYIEIEVKDMQDLIEKIALLNSSSKSWTTQDYILAWSTLYPDYKKLMHYTNIYPLEARIICGILMGNSTQDGGGATRAVKSGTFKIKNEKFGATFLQYLTDIHSTLNISNNKVRRELTQCFYLYYTKIMSIYLHDDFIKFCKVHKESFKKCVLSEQFNSLLYKYQRI